MTSHSPERREPNDMPAGTVINGKFRVVSLLAMGGMGRIYRAEQAPLGRVCALKVLRVPTSATEAMIDEFRKRFFREASILAKLQHANVVTLFDYGRIEGAPDERYFMAMEYLAGETLAARLKRMLVVGPADVLRFMRQIARGLREAHKLGAVHRDLKPSNVMLVPEEDGGEVVKILDFGIGKLLGGDDDQELTQEGAFLGSPKYIAPEQVNERRVDARTDVYALGVIGYECLCGRVPFEGETNLETILAHCNSPVKPMALRSPGVVVPEILEAFVRRCLEKDPTMRPQSMEEVLRGISDVERALFGVTSLGSMASMDAPSSQKTPHMAAAWAPGASTRPSVNPTLALTPQANARPSVGTASPLTRQGSLRPAPGGTRTALVLGAIVVALLGAGIVAVRLATRHGTDAASSDLAPPSSASAAATAAPRSFTLVLDSKPSGADVWDGEDVIGTTPMQVTVDRAGARTTPRRFVLRLDGYVPYTVVQGDSEGIVQVTAPLAPFAAPSVAPSTQPPAATRPTRWVAPRATTGTAATQRPQQDLDIKLQR
jgi:serine/threonine-protein kinase